MITLQDQDNLLTLIAKNLSQDVVCYAFGGNAMMYYGYKDETKDVDIVFLTEEDRKNFIEVLHLLGYQKYSPGFMYVQKKLADPGKPLVFKREEGRFDLFVGRIFQTLLSPHMKADGFAVHQYNGKKILTVHVLRKEHIVILKSVTDRENDLRDVRTILTNEKHFDWPYLLEEVRWQAEHGDGWILLDVEKMMQELKEYVFIPEKYFKELSEVLSSLQALPRAGRQK